MRVRVSEGEVEVEGGVEGEGEGKAHLLQLSFRLLVARPEGIQPRFVLLRCNC